MSYLPDKVVVEKYVDAKLKGWQPLLSAVGSSYLEENSGPSKCLITTSAGTERVSLGMLELMRVVIDFRRFLDYCYFSPEGKLKQCLGDGLWEAQEIFAETAMEHPWVYYLKARQLGESTIGCAYDAWRTRFGAPNSRVHIMSKTEKEAVSLLANATYYLRNLPGWLQLPFVKDSDKEIVVGIEDDMRVAHAYATSTSPGRGETCTHAHLDELAFMENPGKIWAAVEQGISLDSGTCHIITTNDAPESFTANLWRKSIDGESKFHPCFVDALKRPDRTKAWYKAERSLTPNLSDFLRELPMRWEDALSAGGTLVFPTKDIDRAAEDARGFQAWRRGRKYVIGVDVGQKDATVINVLDHTDEVHDVVGWLHLVGASYPTIQAKIEEAHRAYPTALIVIEKNGPGGAMAENLKIPEHMIELLSMTKQVKAEMISTLQAAFQGWCLKYPPEQCRQLDTELRGYMIPDTNIKQDCVMALGIAEYSTTRIVPPQGRMLGIIQV